MPTLLEIAEQQAELMRNSGITVKIDTAQLWVALDSEEEELFLQDHQAEEFISKASKLWTELEYIDEDTADLAVAYQYLDAMSPKQN